MMNVMFVGKMASGKTHASKFLESKYGYIHMALAGPIKELEDCYENMGQDGFEREAYRILHTEGGLSEETVEKFLDIFVPNVGEIPRELPKPRKRYQYIGTDLGRNQISPTIWIDILLHNKNKNINVVIDDTRFQNEIDYLKPHNFVSIKLNVDKDIQRERLQVLYGLSDQDIESALAHASEKEIDDITCDYEVGANQSLIKMFLNIEKILESIK